MIFAKKLIVVYFISFVCLFQLVELTMIILDIFCLLFLSFTSAFSARCKLMDISWRSLEFSWARAFALAYDSLAFLLVICSSFIRSLWSTSFWWVVSSKLTFFRMVSAYKSIVVLSSWYSSNKINKLTFEIKWNWLILIDWENTLD